MMMSESNVDPSSLAETPLDHVDGGSTAFVRQGGSASVRVDG